MVGSVAGEIHYRRLSSSSSMVASGTGMTTYKMEPEIPFRPSVVRASVASAIDDWLKTSVICADVTMSASEIAEIVKNAVKNNCGIDRHKLVVQTYMYEDIGQAIRICSKCLWDGNFDNYVCVERSVMVGENKERLMLVVIVFGLFFE